MKVICIANQKGGIAKTTTAMAIASLYKKEGMRTLLIDADPQGNASDTYGAVIEGQTTLYDLILEEERCEPEDAVQHTALGDIIASDPLLRKSEKMLDGEIDGMFRLKDALDRLKPLYDIVVIDTAPAINMLLYNCLAAADDVVIPVSADRYSIAGLSQLTEAITSMRRRVNPGLSIAGILVARYSGRANFSKAAKDALEKDAEAIGTKLFSTAVRECIKCQEAQASHMHLIDYAPRCTTAGDYMKIFDELKEEIENCRLKRIS